MTGTWRDTLFVWRGAIKFEGDDDEEKVTWSGTWVGCEDSPENATLPSDKEFLESDMKFDVSGSVSRKTKSLTLITMNTGTGWDLQGDDDKIDRHEDDRHTIALSELMDQEVVVAAVGENQFGAFLSAGFLHKVDNDDENLWLTLGRRYLGDRDIRAKWTAESLHEKLSSSNVNDEKSLPWNTHDLYAAVLTTIKRKAKRKRTA